MGRAMYRLFALYAATAAVLLVWAAHDPTLDAWDDAEELKAIGADTMTAESEGGDRAWATWRAIRGAQ